MKLDTVRDKLRLTLESFYKSQGPIGIDPSLIEDTLWFLDLLRKTQGYDVERPAYRGRTANEQAQAQEEILQEYIRNYWKKDSESAWRQGETFEEIMRRAEERMQKERHQYQRSNQYQRFNWGSSEEEKKKSDQPPPTPGKRMWNEVLGVPLDAPRATRQKAYRKLAMKFHPDRGGSHEKMAELTQAAREAGL